MTYFSKVIENLNFYDYLGKKTLDDGTILIGKAIHLAPEAWIHQIYPTLNSREINIINKNIGITLPESYEFFLINYSNGLSIFSEAITLDGLRKIMGRNINVWQPYSIYTPNINERIKDAENSHFFIGGYGYDGSLLYIDKSNSKVYRCSTETVKPLNEWDNFETMLLLEVDRIGKLFDKLGKKIDSKKPTIPSYN